MQNSGSLIRKVSTFLRKGFVVIGVFSLLILPLTASAEVVDVWELDNFFSNVVDGRPVDPDGPRTVTNLNLGDIIRFENMGGVDHDAGNQFVELDGQIFFDKELFGSSAQSPGDVFITPPFTLAGEIPYICFIHGESDMAGTIFVGGGVEPTPTPTPTSSPGPTPSPTPTPSESRYSISCDRPFDIVGNVVTLQMSFIQERNCTLTLTDGTPGETIVSMVNGSPGAVLYVIPPSGITDANGSFNFSVLTGTPGVSSFTVAFGTMAENQTVTFNKNTVELPNPSGFFVIVAPRTEP